MCACVNDVLKMKGIFNHELHLTLLLTSEMPKTQRFYSFTISSIHYDFSPEKSVCQKHTFSAPSLALNTIKNSIWTHLNKKLHSSFHLTHPKRRSLHRFNVSASENWLSEIEALMCVFDGS